MRIGLWALPTYGALLGLSTLTHQPSVDDFDAYARYVTSDTFLLSHLGASVFGAALAIVGATAVAAHLPRKDGAAHLPGESGTAAEASHLLGGRGAVIGLALTTIANVFMAAAFGAAAFVQPGIGRAHLAGVPGMAAINADTAYGPAFFVTALSASFLLMVAAIVFGTAIARSDRRLRWYGIAYAALIPLFVLTGHLAQAAQPFMGFAFAAATAALALALPRTTPSERAATDRAGGEPNAHQSRNCRPLSDQRATERQRANVDARTHTRRH
ncbi:hypothetical protein OWR29_47125 [Actinoplanes sp. Pm04-4]|uniref:DUF4386 family protein n=1 Tax=Paractinoplanes pyxinae TaxID=2997416 RepID=A0ABT4BGI8_9ACTN|nr:hypothetical protein [Actinoplanes pyxinae]MCY1145624.1 hypothetical protein [Actinoplanes pyxinae]